MLSIKKILFATDFSDCARAAQRYAIAFADQFDAELHAIHVLPDVAMMMPDPGTSLALPASYQADLQKEAEKSLEKAIASPAAGAYKLVRVVRTGNPYYEIVDYAEQNQIDLIVVGTHGRGALLHLLMGSVAEKVVRKANCPVLSVHPNEHPK